MAVEFWPPGAAATERDGRLLSKFRDWLLNVVTTFNMAPLRLQIVSRPNLSAAITTTTIELGTLPAGLYRVSVYLRLTQAATSSSSVQATIGWTDGGARTASGTAYTGNAVNVAAVPFTALVRIGAGTTITYAVAYSSSGATPALYSVDVAVEQIPEIQSQ